MNKCGINILSVNYDLVNRTYKNASNLVKRFLISRDAEDSFLASKVRGLSG